MKGLFSAAIMTTALMAGCGPKFNTVDQTAFAGVRDSVQVVDVRTAEEFSQKHIPSSLNVDVNDPHFVDSVKTLLGDATNVAVYCRSGVRSAKAAGMLSKAGLNVSNLDGGIQAWTGTVCDDWDYIVFDGDEAPDFTVELMDGSSLTLSQLKGKVVMLQFTASWCGVCRKEMPHIESEIWQRHKDDPDFVLVALDRDEPREKMERLIELTGITYPLGFDVAAGIYDKYAVHDSGITRNVLIDRDGKIVLRTRLYDEEAFAGLVSKIDGMLAE